MLSPYASSRKTSLRSRARISENGVVFLAIVGTLAFLVAVRTEPYVLLVFSPLAFVSLVLKMMLGESLKFSNITLPSFFFMMYLALMALPSMYHFGQMETDIRYTYLLAMQSVMVTLPFGVWLASLFLAMPNETIRRYATSPVTVTAGDREFVPVYYALLLFAAFAVAAFLLYAPYIPLLKLFVDVSDKVDDWTLRYVAYEQPMVVQFLYAIARRFALIICVLYAYFMSQQKGQAWRTAFWCLFALSLVASSLSLDRGPPVIMVAMFLVAIPIARGLPFFSTRGLLTRAGVLAAACGVGGVISAFQYRSNPSGEFIRSEVNRVAFERILLSPSFIAAKTFERYAGPDTFLHGRRVRMFSVLTGREYVKSTDYIVDHEERLSLLPATFVGDLWRNWGWPAVILGGILVGFAYQCIQVLLFVVKTAAAAVFQTLLLFACITLIPGNAFGILTTAVLVLGSAVGYWSIRWSLHGTKRARVAAESRKRRSVQGRLHAVRHSPNGAIADRLRYLEHSKPCHPARTFVR